MFKIEKCRTRAAYAAKPTKNIKLDLTKIKKKFHVLFESPVLLLIEVDGCKVLVQKYGELIFKDYKPIAELEKIAINIYNEGLLRSKQTAA
jgi:hypothetical protein